MCLYLAIIANGHAFSIVFPVHRNEYCTLFFSPFRSLSISLSQSLSLSLPFTNDDVSVEFHESIECSGVAFGAAESIAAKWRRYMHWTKIEVEKFKWISRYCMTIWTLVMFVRFGLGISVYRHCVRSNCALPYRCHTVLCMTLRPPPLHHFYLFAIFIWFIFTDFSHSILNMCSAYCLQFSCHIIAKQLT